MCNRAKRTIQTHCLLQYDWRVTFSKKTYITNTDHEHGSSADAVAAVSGRSVGSLEARELVYIAEVGRSVVRGGVRANPSSRDWANPSSLDWAKYI
jgi:hypothetical protein